MPSSNNGNGKSSSPSEESSNGDGELSVRVEAQSVRQRWPMADKDRQRIITRLMGIIRNNRATRREATAAARALLMADKLNIEDEKIDDGISSEEFLERFETAVQKGIEAELGRRDRNRRVGSGGNGNGSGNGNGTHSAE